MLRLGCKRLRPTIRFRRSFSEEHHGLKKKRNENLERYVSVEDRKGLMRILKKMQQRADPHSHEERLHLKDILLRHKVEHTSALEKDLREWRETIHTSKDK
ncbi:hypothetical protein MHBO_000306 [Bonamia ostreae]|uniref:Uncharacterized protein n=1 Tax=Bonamia ostreae TaxID=126728 RepID=A0ABV2AFT4_9EUKA